MSLGAGTSLRAWPEKNAALGGRLKLSTGQLFWKGGVRALLRAPRDATPQRNFWQRLRFGAEPDSGERLEISWAPSGMKFGLHTSALAAVHEARVAGNGHTRWALMQPARLKAHGFVLQEMPLPIFTPSGGTWLKVRVRTPSSSLFLNSDGSTREGPTEPGNITASINSQRWFGGDFSKLSVGVRSRYRATSDFDSLQLHTEHPEVFAQVRENKQAIKAVWQKQQGVRVYVSRLF